MFAYEHEAFRVRLAELAGVVDEHVAVQGDKTFRGEPRIIEELPDGVHACTVQMIGHENPWALETYLRDSSLTVAADMFPDCLYMVCDGDEIPHPDAIRQAVEEYPVKGPRLLPVRYHEWFGNWRAPDDWQPPYAHMVQPHIGRLEDFLAADPPGATEVRRLRPWLPCDAVGWHLSNLGGPGMVFDKFGQFCHSEVDNRRDRDIVRMRRQMALRRDVIDRFPLVKTDDVPSTLGQFPHLIGE